MRPDGAEKWVAYGRVPVDVRDDAQETWLDHEARTLADRQGATLAEHIGTELYPHRWVEDDDGRAVAVACPEADADHYLAVVRWWAVPPTDRPAVELPGIGGAQ